MKESAAIQMPNVSERFPKDADSASVEMVGKETVGIALVRLIVLRGSFYLCASLIISSSTWLQEFWTEIGVLLDFVETRVLFNDNCVASLW